MNSYLFTTTFKALKNCKTFDHYYPSFEVILKGAHRGLYYSSFPTLTCPMLFTMALVFFADALNLFFDCHKLFEKDLDANNDWSTLIGLPFYPAEYKLIFSPSFWKITQSSSLFRSSDVFQISRIQVSWSLIIWTQNVMSLEKPPNTSSNFNSRSLAFVFRLHVSKKQLYHSLVFCIFLYRDVPYCRHRHLPRWKKKNFKVEFPKRYVFMVILFQPSKPNPFLLSTLR